MQTSISGSFRIQKAYPFFDDNALDVARFIFGSDPDEVVWHEGWVTIDEEVNPEPEDEEPETGSGYTGGAIMQGMHIAASNGRFCGAKRPQCEADRPQAVAFVSRILS